MSSVSRRPEAMVRLSAEEALQNLDLALRGVKRLAHRRRVAGLQRVFGLIHVKLGTIERVHDVLPQAEAGLGLHPPHVLDRRLGRRQASALQHHSLAQLAQFSLFCRVGTALFCRRLLRRRLRRRGLLYCLLRWHSLGRRPCRLGRFRRRPGGLPSGRGARSIRADRRLNGQLNSRFRLGPLGCGGCRIRCLLRLLLQLLLRRLSSLLGRSGCLSLYRRLASARPRRTPLGNLRRRDDQHGNGRQGSGHHVQQPPAGTLRRRGRGIGALCHVGRFCGAA